MSFQCSFKNWCIEYILRRFAVHHQFPCVCRHCETTNMGVIDRDLNNIAINAHTRLREAHGCGPLEFDQKLAEDAQRWAENLANIDRLEHSETNGKYGENLAYAASSEAANMTGKEATQRWYSEIKFHDFDQEFQSQSGHFTQVIWKATTQAGFGRAHTADNRKVYIVGRYLEAGNMGGQFYKNVPPPLSGQVNLNILDEEPTATNNTDKRYRKSEFKSYDESPLTSAIDNKHFRGVQSNNTDLFKSIRDARRNKIHVIRPKESYDMICEDLTMASTIPKRKDTRNVVVVWEDKPGRTVIDRNWN